jgi:transcriptional regulator with XRE-family HTH domain
MTIASAHAPAREVLRVNVIVGRARVRLSQEELAEHAGISRPTLSRVERAAGDVGLDVIERIAGALGVAVADLLVPLREDRVGNRELARRAAAPDNEFVDADALLEAVDEAAGRIERYSRAGRPSLGR